MSTTLCLQAALAVGLGLFTGAVLAVVFYIQSRTCLARLDVPIPPSLERARDVVVGAATLKERFALRRGERCWPPSTPDGDDGVTPSPR